MFDWDGTFVDSTRFIEKLAKYVLEELKFDLKAIMELHKITYMKFSELAEMLSKELNQDYSRVYDDLLTHALKLTRYLKFRFNLKQIKQLTEDFVVGIITNNDRRIVEKKLKHRNIKFDFILGSQDIRDKADAIKFLLHKYKLKPKQAIYVGDSPSDMKQAKEIGVVAIWYPNLFFNDLTMHEHYDYRISNTDELFQVIYSLPFD